MGAFVEKNVKWVEIALKDWFTYALCLHYCLISNTVTALTVLTLKVLNF